jgi:hypothetical protein
MPTRDVFIPFEGEDKEDFIKQCVHYLSDYKGDMYPTTRQRYAIAHKYWNKHIKLKERKEDEKHWLSLFDINKDHNVVNVHLTHYPDLTYYNRYILGSDDRSKHSLNILEKDIKKIHLYIPNVDYSPKYFHGLFHSSPNILKTKNDFTNKYEFITDCHYIIPLIEYVIMTYLYK